MRYVLFIASLTSAFLSTQLYAQSGEIIIENDLQQEITRESGGYQEVIEVPAQQQVQTRKVLILNRSNDVQQQPITNVQATPLTDSRASQLRRAREDAEVSTEQKIVEKLEQSRLEDERERALRLFGNKLDNQNVQTEVASPVAPAVQVINQEPAVQQQSINDMKADIISSMKEELSAQDNRQESKNKLFISGQVGTSGYQDAINVESNEVLGFSVGTRIDDNFVLEGGFMYSNHYVDQMNYNSSSYFVYDDLDQYNFLAVTKYAPKLGRFSPQLGGIVSYTYRKYTEVNANSSYYHNYNSQYNISQDSETHSFDMGVSLGMEFELSDTFIIGADYRYFFNVTSKSTSRTLNDYYSYNNVGTPLEEFNYYTFGVVGKVSF